MFESNLPQVLMLFTRLAHAMDVCIKNRGSAQALQEVTQAIYDESLELMDISHCATLQSECEKLEMTIENFDAADLDHFYKMLGAQLETIRVHIRIIRTQRPPRRDTFTLTFRILACVFAILTFSVSLLFILPAVMCCAILIVVHLETDPNKSAGHQSADKPADNGNAMKYFLGGYIAGRVDQSLAEKRELNDEKKTQSEPRRPYPHDPF